MALNRYMQCKDAAEELKVRKQRYDHCVFLSSPLPVQWIGNEAISKHTKEGRLLTFDGYPVQSSALVQDRENPSEFDKETSIYP